MRALRIGFGSLATLVLGAGLSLATPAVALGAAGFTERATTTYVVNAEQQRLDVTIDLTFRNTKRSTATTVYYYNSDYLWLEKDATNIRATSPGATMTISRVKTEGQYSEYRFRWEPVLFYGKSRTVHITYQVPGGAPRSTSWFRISPAYLDFCVIGTGLDGGETLIKVPLSYSMSIDSQENGRLGSRIEGDTRVYTTGTNADAFKFWACLTGERADRFASTRLTAPSGREIDIQAWPDDPSWTTDISTQLDGVLQGLEDLTGRGLPGDGPIAVREVGAGTLGQYAGFFDPTTGIARIGEDLDAKGLIVHELSHAWFNGSLFQASWLSEGHAEWARTSIDGDTCPAPPGFPGTGAPNLEAWRFAGPRATEDELRVVDWQYAAACALITQVAARIGEDGMRTVLEALARRDLAYRSGQSILRGPNAAANWQSWLDTIDEIGLAAENTATSVATIADLLEPYGITAGDRAALQQRADARRQFHALEATFGEWTVPEVVLRAMAGWHFTAAVSAMDTATDVWDAAARVGVVLPGVDGLTGNARTMLEAATTQADLEAALAAATDRLAAAETVASASAAMTAPRDFVMQVGVLGTDLQPLLDAAIQAVRVEDLAAARSGSEAIQAALADAPKQGQVRLLLGIGIPVLLLLALAFVLFRRRRRRAGLAPATVSGTEEPSLATLDAALAPPASPVEGEPPSNAGPPAS